jgi:hypothetical protein
VFTVRDANEELNVSFAIANNAAQALLKAGILSVPEDVRCNRLFHGDAVLNIFDRFRVQPVPTSKPEPEDTIAAKSGP